MTYDIAIVEDNDKSQEILISYLNKYAEENSIKFKHHIFNDGDEITSDYESKYDIIFLDVEMKRLDGMSAAAKIRKLDTNVIIIFITNMSQYAIKGYLVDALSFLLKPVPYFAFAQEMKKAIERISKNKKIKSVLVQTEKGMKKVLSTDIMYVESVKHDIFVVTRNEEFQIKSTMKKMEELLNDARFFRSNNSYLVNLDYVSGIKDDFVAINGQLLKIARPRKKEFMEALTAYIGGKI